MFHQAKENVGKKKRHHSSQVTADFDFFCHQKIEGQRRRKKSMGISMGTC